MLGFEKGGALALYLCSFIKSYNFALPQFTHLVTSPYTSPDEFPCLQNCNTHHMKTPTSSYED